MSPNGGTKCHKMTIGTDSGHVSDGGVVLTSTGPFTDEIGMAHATHYYTRNEVRELVHASNETASFMTLGGVGLRYL